MRDRRLRMHCPSFPLNLHGFLPSSAVLENEARSVQRNAFTSQQQRGATEVPGECRPRYVNSCPPGTSARAEVSAIHRAHRVATTSDVDDHSSDCVGVGRTPAELLREF